MSMPYLMHEGTPHEGPIPHSGRYPYGSGEHAYQRAKDFMSIVAKREAEGIKGNKELAASFNMTTREFNARRQGERAIISNYENHEYQRLLDEGLTVAEIAHRKGVPVSTMRSRLKSLTSERSEAIINTANLLERNIAEKKYLDVGEGVAAGLGISQTRFDAALQLLAAKGYEIENIRFKQSGFKENDTNHTTVVKVLAAPGVTKEELYNNGDKIGLIVERYESPKSNNLIPLRPIQNVSSDRIMIRYGDNGGADRDGLIELRPGVEDLSMGFSRYAQVRIGVDGTHYLKGVAMYNPNMPEGVDIIFNTNKKTGTPAMSDDPDASQVFKPMKFPDEVNNPFGASIKNGGQRGALNIVQEEGDWAGWSRNLASQFLSKQSERLVKTQLDLARLSSMAEFEEIKELTNGSLKRKMLQDFADAADTAAVNLKAHAMAGQTTNIILPVQSLKETQIYAPHYHNGDSLILIRYPHGGTFEIPRLTVNNNNREAKASLADAVDAVGVNPKVCAQLSGADFDGDFVITIPDNDGRIINSPPYQALLEFDNKKEYTVNHKTMSVDQRNKEMGVATNLIADMTVGGADAEEIIRAVKYSMVVIDAAKHNLDWRQAKKDFRIQELKDIYQPREGVDAKGNPLKGGGSHTIMTKAKSPVYRRLPKRSYIDPETGKKIEIPNTGKAVRRPAMLFEDDANALVSEHRHPVELIYADYANSMKALANSARLEILATERTPYNKAMAREYRSEVDSLKAKVNDAIKHSPYERRAGLIADYKARTAQVDMSLSEADTRKYRSRFLNEARASLGGGRPKFTLTDKEWTAIQKGAVPHKLLENYVFKYVDDDELKKRALPRERKGLSDSKIRLAKSLIAAGNTASDVAERLGVSVNTLNNAIYSKN